MLKVLVTMKGDPEGVERLKALPGVVSTQMEVGDDEVRELPPEAP